MAQHDRTHEARITRNRRDIEVLQLRTDSLEESRTRYDELLKSGMSETLAAKIVGLTDDQVRETLGIRADTTLTDSAVLTGIVTQVGKAKRGAETANERATQLERRFDDVINEVAQYLGEDGGRLLQRDVAQGMSLRSSLLARGLTDDEIRIMLQARDEQDLSDADFVMVLVNRLSLVESRVEHLEAIVGEDGANLVTTDNVHEYVDGRPTIPAWGWVTAIIVFVLVWLFVWIVPYSVHGNVHDNDGHAVGTFDAGWHSGRLGFFLGLLAGGVVLMFSRGYGRRTVEETETVETREDTRRSHWWDGLRQHNANRTVEREEPVAPSNDEEVVETTTHTRVSDPQDTESTTTRTVYTA